MTAPNIADPFLVQTDRLQTGEPGILVLTPPLRIVYANAVARALASRLKQVVSDEKPGPGLPDKIHDFCEEVMDLLEDRYRSAHFGRFDLRREIQVVSDRLLLRGIGFLTPGAEKGSYACIMMDLLRTGMDRSGGRLTKGTSGCLANTSN
jgi:hypothetical protein